MREQISEKQFRVLAVLYTLIALAIVYGQVVNHGWLSYGDLGIVRNPAMRSDTPLLTGIAEAFSLNANPDWQPLTTLSHLFVGRTLGLAAPAHHGVNVLLHAMNTLLLFYVFRRMSGSFGASMILSALFALHPLHVEAVAWATGRRELLSAFFLLLALAAYHRYAENTSAKSYMIFSVAFLLMLFSNALMFSAVVLFFLVDIWPLDRYAETDLRGYLRRFGRLSLEKAPLLILAGIAVFLNSAGQGAIDFVQSPDAAAIGERLVHSSVASADGLVKSIFPSGLAVLYPYQGEEVPLWKVVCSIAVFLLMTTLALLQIRRRPYIAVGWFWYLSTSLPGVMLHRPGTYAMEDRFMYVPLVGVCIAGVWGLADVSRAVPLRKGARIALTTVVLLVFGGLSYFQTHHWERSQVLYEHTLDAYPESALAHRGMSVTHLARNRAQLAANHLLLAVELEPRNADLRHDLAIAFIVGKRLDAAEKQLRFAIDLDPGNPARAAVLNNLRERRARRQAFLTADR